MQIEIRTVEEVGEHVQQVMRTLAAVMRQDRTVLGHATIAATMFAVIRYADAREDPLQATEAVLTFEWLCAIWSRPEEAWKGARDRMGRIGSLAAIEALAASAPGTAWSEFAKYEMGRRRGTITDWREENGVIRVEAAPRQPSSAGGTEG